MIRILGLQRQATRIHQPADFLGELVAALPDHKRLIGLLIFIATEVGVVAQEELPAVGIGEVAAINGIDLEIVTGLSDLALTVDSFLAEQCIAPIGKPLYGPATL